MNIYFHIDELNRDAVVASALKKLFAKQGHTLIYGNRLTNPLIKYFHSIFDVIIIPRPHILYDNWQDAWMNWNVRFVMLATESLGIICKDHQVMARTLLEKEYFQGTRKYVERIDAFCVWGTKQRQAIEDYGDENVLKKFHVVGHPRHDSLCWNTVKKTPPAKTKTIGIITRSVGLNDYFSRSPLSTFSTLFNNHFQYEFINHETGEKLASKRPAAKPAEALIVQVIDAENTLNIINRLIKAGYKVNLRVHPKEDSNGWSDLLKASNLDVDISEARQPIASWLNGIDYLIGPPSTSFYDAMMLGVTPISIGDLDKRRQECIGELWEDNNQLMAHVFKPETIDELLEYINNDRQTNTNENMRIILKEEADFPECKNALNKVVDVCLANPVKRKASVFNFQLFKLMRMSFFKLWKIKSKLIGRRENSALFTMGKKESRFIDNLTSVQ